MALTITTPVTELFDPNVTDSANFGIGLLAGLNNADPETSRACGLRPRTFSAEGKSLGNEAVTLALLAPIDLTALGVPFNADDCRNLLVKCWSRRVSQANWGYTEKLYMVQGGATPSIPADITVAAALAAVNDPKVIVRIPNNNSASAPEYGEGIVIMDAVSTTHVIVGVQNILGTTEVATATPGMRWRLEVMVLPKVTLPIFA